MATWLALRLLRKLYAWNDKLLQILPASNDKCILLEMIMTVI